MVSPPSTTSLPPERICGQCHKVFRIVETVCPEDGGKLHTVATAEAMVGRDIDGKLTLVGVLGQGGMGVVYRARQHSMDREVAVKILHPGFAGDAEAVRRFLHEARAASRLDHPNIITVFDFGRTADGLLYLVMELLAGSPLAKVVDAGPMPAARAVHVLAQVADAVDHAHARGLVHRDLKPENVFLLAGSALRGEHVKVLDFGIATTRAQEGFDRVTRTGSVCGTPAYMSPEQVLGDEVDGRSDVYALGVMAFEMLTGVHPLRAETPVRQMLAHLEQPVPSFRAVGAPAVPVAVEAVVRRALEKKRELRPATALAFADELLAAMRGASALAMHVKPLDSRLDQRAIVASAAARLTPPAPRRWRRALPYAGVVSVIALALGFLSLAPPTHDGPEAVVETVARAPRSSPDPTPTLPAATHAPTTAAPVAARRPPRRRRCPRLRRRWSRRGRPPQRPRSLPRCCASTPDRAARRCWWTASQSARPARARAAVGLRRRARDAAPARLPRRADRLDRRERRPSAGQAARPAGGDTRRGRAPRRGRRRSSRRLERPGDPGDKPGMTGSPAIAPLGAAPATPWRRLRARVTALLPPIPVLSADDRAAFDAHRRDQDFRNWRLFCIFSAVCTLVWWPSDLVLLRAFPAAIQHVGNARGMAAATTIAMVIAVRFVPFMRRHASSSSASARPRSSSTPASSSATWAARASRGSTSATSPCCRPSASR
ncbi:MAG: serine/threonine-protein kinase [Myxococcota bacterium]